MPRPASREGEYYVLLVEERYCVPDECGKWAGFKDCPHEKGIRWTTHKTLFHSVGPAHAQMNSLVNLHANYNAANMSWQTGRSEIMVLNLATLVPYYDEAEQAALRISGLEAAKKLRKSRGKR